MGEILAFLIRARLIDMSWYDAYKVKPNLNDHFDQRYPISLFSWFYSFYKGVMYKWLLYIQPQVVLLAVKQKLG